MFRVRYPEKIDFNDETCFVLQAEGVVKGLRMWREAAIRRRCERWPVLPRSEII